MSAAHAKCRCAHIRHRGQCPNPACGCLVYRPRATVIPVKVPRVIRGAVLRELEGSTS